jgi:hypothetical protein
MFIRFVNQLLYSRHLLSIPRTLLIRFRKLS